MGNIFAPATPKPEPQFTVEYRRPEHHAPENHGIPLRNRQPPIRNISYPYYARETCTRGNNRPLEPDGNIPALPEPRPNLQLGPIIHVPRPIIQPRPNIGWDNLDLPANTQPQTNVQPRPYIGWGDLEPLVNVQPRPAVQPRPNLQTRGPCRFFVRGHCNKGAACRFSHDKNSTAGKENQGQGSTGKATADDGSSDNDTFELGGAWVKFDNGATVSKITFSSDYSAVNVRNLPQDSSVNSVRALLRDVGIHTSAVEIRVMAQTEQNQCSAIMKAEDPSFAKTVCDKLDTYTTLPGIKATVIAPILPHNQSLYQVDCRKVHCAWSRPVREARLTFGAKNTAIRVNKGFKAGSYKVLGSRVTAAFPGNQKGQDGWLVMLTALGSATKEQDIIQAIPESDRPRNVQLGEPNYVADLEFDSTIVKSMLLEFGQLERWDVSSSSKAKRFTANAIFLEEASARDAMSSLHNKLLSFSDTTKLSLSLVASAKFKVPVKIYDVVRPRINAQKAIWERQYIRSFEIPLKGLYRILKLEGDNHRLMVQAKEAVEKIIGGEIVRMDGKDLRCGNFRNGGKEFKKVKLIEDTFKVVIVPDIRRSQFRVFGHEECSRHALERITTMLQDCISESHVIELDDVDFKWVSAGGLRLLKSQLGEGTAAFDITSKYKRIFIRGSRTDYNNAMAIIASKQIMSLNTISHSEMECPSCFCEAEDPIRMSCDHVYCSDCFVQMCVAEMTATREFRICCVKATDSNGKICQKAFSLSEIQEHLPSETFEDMLEKSFESYVTRHPDGFTYCPSPDCDQIYRISSPDSERPSTFTCKKCLTSTCTICHNSHPGRPCAGGNRSNALSNKTKEELGIKACPKCKTLMEKRGGCNHMTCKCGAHVCWVCLVSFDASEHCYDHMRRVHGGIGI
ncbi:hypothetical protein V8C37DRAFT_274579 [Trichoderma ceciliae]